MERASFAEMDCPIARAVDVIGEGWTLLLLREAFKGARTFSQFQSALPIAPTTLTRRLETMCERGLFERVIYRENPPRDDYVPTERALELLPIFMALGAWGNRWLAPKGDIFTIVDAETERPMDVAVVDRKTSKPVRAGKVALRAGPGASAATKKATRSALVLGTRQPRTE